MIKRTLFFSNNYHLSTENFQLKAASKESGELKSVPIEDVGYVIFEHPQITFTQSVMQLLAENNSAVIFCDAKHRPSSMLLHLDTNYVQSERFKEQLNASEALKKQLWKQTIQCKIENQAKLLETAGIDGRALWTKAKQVKSGDSSNEEAKAARLYWKRLFGHEFLRERFGEAPNPALNYGYAILRAAVARALSGSGLLSTFGIHHRNKYNAFCLADDIMEPYRPFVDYLVWQMQVDGMETEDLGTNEKKALLKLLTLDTQTEKQISPLQIALSRTTHSLAKCFEGEQRKIIYPEFKA
jgi:CRISPR-associated protein Cas1